MAYGTPADPVASTVITVAYAVTNLLDPIRALRAFTGGSDPPGSGYVVTADSTSATTWKTLLAAITTAFGQGTVAANINTSGTISTSSTSANSIVTQGGISAQLGIATAAAIQAASAAIAGAIAAASATFTGNAAVNGTATLGAANIVGAGSIGGNGTVGGTWSVTGALSAASAALVGGLTAASALVSGVVQASRFTSTVATGTAPFTVASTTEVTNLRAATAGHATAADDSDALDGVTWKQPLSAEFNGSQALTTSYADVSGASVAADRNGWWLFIINAHFTAAIGDGIPSCQIVAGATPQEEGAGALASGTTTGGPAVAIAMFSVSGSTTVKVQVKKASGSAGSVCTHAKVTGFWLAP